jgi:hypothetical protein
MNTFKSALAICGLSQSEAALFFDISLQSVKSMSLGRRTVPEGIWIMLADLFEQIQDAADYAAGHMIVEDIDPRMWSNIQADLGHDPIPISGAVDVAGAMALLTSVKDRD